MSEIIYDQTEMLAQLPRHKERGREHVVLPRYQHVAKLLQHYKYTQNQLAFLQKEINNIEPYKENDHGKF